MNKYHNTHYVKKRLRTKQILSNEYGSLLEQLY